MEEGNFSVFRTDDGTINVDVVFSDETVWLTIDSMATMFGKSRSTINEHILNVFSEGELVEADSVRKIGNSDFSTKPTNYYNLDKILTMSGEDLLTGAGSISHKQAEEKAMTEYRKYQAKTLSEVETAFLDSIETLEKIEKAKHP